ncbi:MAG TPA: hypothetical protein VGN57_18490 [Pirellulaceae bacterium]|jgi:hypothetical protein|nr:hypothetical protein [Pirellulaceae bacterium]
MSHSYFDSLPKGSTEVEVPAEMRRASGGTNQAVGCALAGIFLLFPAVVYFGFFALLLIDELVLNTRYLGRENLPDWLVEWIEFIYYPLIVLVRWALVIE